MKILGTLLCLVLLASTAMAEDNDEKFDQAVRDFGYNSGLAYQCVPDTEKVALEKDVLKAFTGLISLFGSDDAFFYAAAYGAGSTAKYDKKKCKQYVENFREAMQQGKRDK